MRSQFHHPRLSLVRQALSHPEHWFAGPAGCCFGKMMKEQPLESVICDAVIRSKLLYIYIYSLENIHLTQSLCKKLDVFHLRGSRRIPKLATMYIDRCNTNARVHELPSEAASPNQLTKKVNTCFHELDERRARLAGHSLRAPNCRVGRPRQQWLLGLTKSSTIG